MLIVFRLLASWPVRAAPTYGFETINRSRSTLSKGEIAPAAVAERTISPSTYLARKNARTAASGNRATNWPQEIEPNDTTATATALSGTAGVVQGDIFGPGELDFFSFTANAGDRIYAAVSTSNSANGSFDSTLQLIGTDGVTLIEQDNDDGAFASTSSTIAGATLPTTGTYYFRVSHNVATLSMRPYRLYYQLRSGAPVAETEPNDTFPGQAMPAGGWVSGSLSSTTDVDFFTLNLNAGDTVFLSLDLDPARGGVATSNAQLGFGAFGTPPLILVANDASSGPLNSEAFFMTVKDSGTYAAAVSVPAGGSAGNYHLSVTVLPKPSNGGVCTTYSSIDTVAIPSDPGMVTSTLTIPGTPQIDSITVGIYLTHNFMSDLDVQLTSPEGSTVGLFSDIGSTTVNAQTTMNVVFDDDAALPPLFNVVNGMRLQPELNYRLAWFHGVNAGGTWTLTLRDDATGDGGNLYGWDVTVCEPPPPPVCAVGFVQTTVYSTDFESGAAGFTHSGTQDEWELGLPTAAPITTCASGNNCWKTDLDGTHDILSNQDLFSPNINLVGLSAPVVVNWSHKFHMERADFDQYTVEARQVGTPSNRVLLFEHTGATMNDNVGNPIVTIPEAAGWGKQSARIDSLAGQNVELRFNVTSDNSVNLTGVAVDDVSVTACMPVTADLSITKVDTPDPVTAGNAVTYTITATNAGPATASTVSVSDTLPAGTTFTSLSSPGGWSCTTPAVGAGGTVTCSTPAFAAGSAVFTLVAGVAPATVSGTVLSNTATISSSTTDPAPGNNSATATTTVTTSADVSVTLGDTPDPVTAGSNVTYTVTMTNLGPSDAQAVGLALPLPAVTTFVSATATAGGSCTTPAVGANGTVSCSWAGATAPAGTNGVTVVATVDPSATGNMSATATVSTTSTDPVSGNNTAMATTTITTLTHTVTPFAGANGTIAGTMPVTVNHGATTTFTVTPAMGYTASASGCGGSLVGTLYTTAPIVADCTVTASFAQNSFQVTVLVPGVGGVSPTGPVTVAQGATTSFNILTPPGYLPQVSGCGGTLVGNVYTTGPITAACSVVVTFALAAATPVPLLPAGWGVLLTLLVVAIAVAGRRLRARG